MTNKDPVHVSEIIKGVLKKLSSRVPKFSDENDVSVREIQKSIGERERLREVMRMRWAGR
jgi:hypothetical protein